MSFTLLKDRNIPEINSTVRLYRHEKTGARFLSIINTDENKVFGVSFRTPPKTSNGVPHILEHTVLGGSRKYPVKDPFTELMKGSLNTFLNAMTFPDKTCYPVASQNVKDLYNLADVYMDAVFHPLIEEKKFWQEGWHLEVENPDAPLKFNGIVFNEMKGALSSPDQLIDYDLSQRSLYPDTPYGLNSGGDPAVIPDLTYEDFKAFHQRYYHPSNSYIYFYGDDDPEERLKFLDAWLEEFDFQPVDSILPLQPHFTAPRRVEHAYDSGGNPDARWFLTVNWLLPETGDPLTMLSFAILGHILTATPASPLRKALIDSGLGEDLAGPGLDDSLRQMYYSTGLKGIHADNMDKVETLILDTLKQLARDGIDPNTVAASLNTVEFGLREKNTGRFPRGLAMMFGALSSWLHEGDPLDALAFEAPLQTIKDEVAGGKRYFEEMIQKHLLDNPHRTTVILRPDPEEGKRQAAAEQERLNRIRSAMSVEDVEIVMRSVEGLRRMQNMPDTPEALAKIPTLKLSDLDKSTKKIPLEIKMAGEPSVIFHNIPTNGIVYMDVGFDMHVIPLELISYLGLFGRLLLEMGTEKQDYVSLTQRIGRSTGGIHSELLTSAVRESEQSALWFFLRGKAMVPQVGEMLAILKEVLLTAKLDDRERFKQIVLEEKSNLEAGLIPMGSRFINRRLRAHFHPADWVFEQVNMLDYLFFIRQVATDIEKDWKSIQANLEKVRRLLINRRTMLINVTVDSPTFDQIHPQLADFIHGIPAFEKQPMNFTYPTLKKDEGFSVPSPVNYVGKGINFYALGIEPHGSAKVINNHLANTWLYEKVRLQGGAYGGFSAFDETTGTFTFLSYRDPNLLDTLEIYDHTELFLSALNLTEAELTKSIIGTVGEMDTYLLPDARGFESMTNYLTDRLDEVRQRTRDEVLGTTAEDFKQIIKAFSQVSRQGKVVVLGSAEAMESANKEKPGLLETTKVM